jgi:hypothetical protein
LACKNLVLPVEGANEPPRKNSVDPEAIPDLRRILISLADSGTDESHVLAVWIVSAKACWSKTLISAVGRFAPFCFVELSIANCQLLIANSQRGRAATKKINRRKQSKQREQ